MEKLKLKKGPQQEAFDAIQKSLNAGKNKMAIVMATGSGKTEIAIAAVKSYIQKHGLKRVLFVTHLQQIWNQTQKRFKNYMPEFTVGFYAGNQLDEDSAIIVGSVKTISNHIKNDSLPFKKDYFDIIIIDEFHHSASATFKTVLNHFEPKVLLGMSCMSTRNDDKQFLHYFDNNIVYELDTPTAVERKAISDIKYYATFTIPEISYPLHINGKYYEEQNRNRSLVIKNLDEKLIDKQFKKHTDKFIDEYVRLAEGKKTIAFCASISHAKKAAKAFNKRGIKALAIHSPAGTETEEDMQRRTEEFLDSKGKPGQCLIACTIDKWLEGADIPDAEVAMFLRPTKSWRVFIQSRGRVTRLHPNKEFAIVIDCVGSITYIKIWRETVIEEITFMSNRLGHSTPNDLRNVNRYSNSALVEIKRDLKEELKKYNEENYPELTIGRPKDSKTKQKAIYDHGIFEVHTELIDDHFCRTGEKKWELNIFFKSIESYKTKCEKLNKKFTIPGFCKDRNVRKELVEDFCKQKGIKLNELGA